MRLLTRTEAPSEDTPPSTRPSSAASNSTSNSGPQRSTSMDSIHTSSSLPEKPAGEEIIPTRFTRSTPRVNINASMQFVKTKPAALYKTARVQIQKADEIKSLRKTSLQEEEEYQIKSTSVPQALASEDQDWQSNLDKWKSSRRKRNEEILERVIESKKFEEDPSRVRRKSKTFSEMRQENKDKRGRRFNIVVHDDDVDFSDLGITPSAKPSIEEKPEEVEEGREGDNKDSKSDAGFCTGSDTGSDGVFAEDNISDTSSALGDKKETLELLPEVVNLSKTKAVNGFSDETSSFKPTKEPLPKSDGHTFDKAIEQYKRFTERSRLKSTSMTNINQNGKDELKKSASQAKLQDKLGYFSGELAREERIIPKMRWKSKEKMQKVDIKKRRSMFELRYNDEEEKSDTLKASIDLGDSLRSRVSSFQKQEPETKQQAIIPQRDSKFKEKLAAFNQKNYCETFSSKTSNTSQVFNKNSYTFSKKQPPVDTGSPATSLKQKIASFERASPDRAKSVSTECLSKSETSKSNSLASTNDYIGRSPSSPFLVMEAETKSDHLSIDLPKLRNHIKTAEADSNRKTVYEQVEKSELKRITDNAPIYSIFNHIDSQKSIETPQADLESSASDHGDNLLDGTYLSMKNRSPSEIASNNVANQSGLYVSMVQQEAADVKTFSAFSTESFPPLPPIPMASNDEGVSSLDFDSLEPKDEYGDADIDEVIQNYESIKSSTQKPDFLSSTPKINKSTCDDTKEDEENIYEQLGDSTMLDQNAIVPTPLNFTDTTLPADHTYQSLMENTLPNDHTYQMIPDKSFQAEHTYQSLEELHEEMDDTPPLPMKKAPGLALEVLDVSWTEDCGRPNPAIPPSIPPPAPPVEDEEGLVEDGGMRTEVEKPNFPGAPKAPRIGEIEIHSPFYENIDSRFDADSKRTLMMKRSQFLGMPTPYVAEEVSVKPPPDMTEFIRQERDSERQLIQNRTRQAQSDFSDIMSPSRFKYTWEDRMKQDNSNDLDTSDTSSSIDYQCRLAELERDMERHDRDMINRTNRTDDDVETSRSTISSPLYYMSSDIAPVQESVANHTALQKEKPLATSSKSFPIQEFYSAPASQNNYLSANKIHTPDLTFAKNHSLIPPPNVQPPPKPSRSMSEVGLASNISHKQNIKALSAIPKPKRVENDSWIVKKSESSKRNYNNHWLIQEAEQRRLDSLARQTSAPVIPFRPPNLLPAPISYSTAIPQPPVASSLPIINKPQIHPPKPTIQNPAKLYVSDNSSIYANTCSYSTPSSNSSSDSINCKLKGITYNPHKPSPPQKPLPQSIISTITQRVTNKGKPNSSNDRPVLYTSRSVNNDYINSEALDASRNQHDIMPSALTANLINARHATAGMRSTSRNGSPADLSAMLTPSSEEQRLLSVSGKKKCSHCCDELGRGAAMIIESLRLFYHIPCFKCCVCGIQLGNGTAGADVRVRNHKLHCHNCYSNDEGMKFSKV